MTPAELRNGLGHWSAAIRAGFRLRSWKSGYPSPSNSLISTMSRASFNTISVSTVWLADMSLMAVRAAIRAIGEVCATGHKFRNSAE
jgi:hypothetical protein